MIRSGMAKFHDDLETLMRPIDDIQPHPSNYNNGDIEAVTTSIEVSGMYRPVYVQRSTGYILAGNHTWMACKTLGAEIIPTVVLDVDDTQGKRIMIADNKIAQMAQPDNGLLVALLDEIEAEGETIVGTGFTAADLEVLRHLNEIPLDTDDDFGQWPTFSVQVPPNVLRAYKNLTREADDDRAGFELLLRLAGWDGS